MEDRMTDLFWSFDGETFETHATADRAREHAQAGLDFYRDHADEGWAEEVTQIMWGPIAEHVVEGERQYHHNDCDDDDCHEDCPLQTLSNVDYVVDYFLAPTRPSAHKEE